MGLLSFIRDAVENVADWVTEKVEDAVDWVKDKLSARRYDEDNVEDHVDVDAVLADFRVAIRESVETAENRCMNSVSVLFSDLTDKTKSKFSDLVTIIENKQEAAEKELKGTFMKYVTEHLSKNDPQFLKVLKMSPGKAKKAALDTATDQVLNDAERVFNFKLKKYAEHLLEEFSERLNIRIADQEEQMNRRIGELEKLQAEAEEGQIDIEALKENCAPAMEAAECMKQVLEMER